MNEMTRAGILISSAAAATVLALSGPAAVSAAPGPAFTVMTYNIASAVETANDLDPIADTIEREDPDVVGLQEVDRSWSRSDSLDQAGQLAARLGMFSSFDPNLDCSALDFDADGTCEYGTAILSRRRIRASATRQYTLPRRGTDEPRGLAQVGITIAGRRVTLFNTHLSVPRAGHAPQIRSIVQVLAHTRGPYVVTGDFNTPPNAPELRVLRARAVDAARLMQVRRPTVGTTRVDYVFVSKDIAVVRARVPRPAARRVSDHRPLIVRLRLGGSGG